MTQFIPRLTSLIKNSGKTQTEICKELGISKQKMTNWKSGYTQPSIDDIVMLARYFGVTTDYLLGLED